MSFDLAFSFDDFSGEMLNLTANKKKKYDRIFRITAGGSVDTKPVIHNGRVYFGATDSYFYCADTKTGKEIWRFRTGDWVASAVSIHENRIFIGSFDGNMYCLNAATGREIWRFKTGAEVFNIHPFLINNEIIYFGSLDSFIYAVSIETGKEVWRFKTGKYGNCCAPVLCKNFLLQASRDGFLYALSLEGKELWRFNYGKVIGPLVVHDDKIYVCGEDSYLCCLDMEGKELWRFVMALPAFWESEIHENTIYLGSYDCHLYAIDINTRKERWRFATSSSVISSLPPAYEGWETQIEIPRSEEIEEKKSKYAASIFGSELFGQYKTESPYKTKSAYKTKSEYK
jgi:outer membrane protein assembly factor BamB